MNQLDIPENLFVCSLKKIPVSFERTCHTSPPPMMMMILKEFSAGKEKKINRPDKIKGGKNMKHSNCFIFHFSILVLAYFHSCFYFYLKTCRQRESNGTHLF
jgi:hypothetical protein